MNGARGFGAPAQAAVAAGGAQHAQQEPELRGRSSRGPEAAAAGRDAAPRAVAPGPGAGRRAAGVLAAAAAPLPQRGGAAGAGAVQPALHTAPISIALRAVAPLPALLNLLYLCAVMKICRKDDQRTGGRVWASNRTAGASATLDQLCAWPRKLSRDAHTVSTCWLHPSIIATQNTDCRSEGEKGIIGWFSQSNPWVRGMVGLTRWREGTHVLVLHDQRRRRGRASGRWAWVAWPCCKWAWLGSRLACRVQQPGQLVSKHQLVRNWPSNLG